MGLPVARNQAGARVAATAAEAAAEGDVVITMLADDGAGSGAARRGRRARRCIDAGRDPARANVLKLAGTPVRVSAAEVPPAPV